MSSLGGLRLFYTHIRCIHTTPGSISWLSSHWPGVRLNRSVLTCPRPPVRLTGTSISQPGPLLCNPWSPSWRIGRSGLAAVPRSRAELGRLNCSSLRPCRICALPPHCVPRTTITFLDFGREELHPGLRAPLAHRHRILRRDFRSLKPEAQ